MNEHPSGRPIRTRIVKSRPRAHGTSRGFWNERLNGPPDDQLAGGCGFLLPSDYSYLEGSWAKRRP